MSDEKINEICEMIEEALDSIANEEGVDVDDFTVALSMVTGVTIGTCPTANERKRFVTIIQAWADKTALEGEEELKGLKN